MTRLSLLEAEYEVDGSPFNAGRLAFHKGDTDNPFWDAQAPYSWQESPAQEWHDGWLAEQARTAKEKSN